MKKVIFVFLFCTIGMYAQRVPSDSIEFCCRYITDSILLGPQCEAIEAVYLKLRPDYQTVLSQMHSSIIGHRTYKIESIGSIPTTGLDEWIAIEVQRWYDKIQQRQQNTMEYKAALVKHLSFLKANACKLPDFYRIIQKKFKGDIQAYVDNIYSQSMLFNPKKLSKFKRFPSAMKMRKDPGIQFIISRQRFLVKYDKDPTI